MKRVLFLSTIAVMVALGSCTNDNDPKTPPPSVPKIVYIGGSESNASDVPIAKYWKDGVGVALSESAEGCVNSISVANGNVYAAGYEKDSQTQKNVAKYWINDVDHVMALTDGSTDACANSIFVDGSTVYVAGFEENASGSMIAKLWVNDKDHSEALHTDSSSANAITVSGGNVYVAGWVERESELGMGIKNTICTYWENKTATEVTDGTFRGELFSIAVSGDDVYVAGFERDASGGMIAKYWKNDKTQVVALSEPGTYAQGSSIFVRGGDVYVAGYDTNAAKKYVAKYWKNDRSNEVVLSSETEYHAVTAACMSDLDMYVVGLCMEPWSGCYWKNGEKMQFATENAAEFTCVTVQ